LLFSIPRLSSHKKLKLWLILHLYKENIKMPVIIKSSFAKLPTATSPGLLGVNISGSDPVVKSIHIGLLMDTSGSMEGDRISSVKRTLSVLINQLRVDDKITVVGFSNAAKVILDSVFITADNKATLIGQIDGLTATGGTNLEAGISGLGQLMQSPPNAIVVLTDGHINEGLTSVAGLYSMVTSYMKSVPVYTLGYGTEHNADLLKELSSRSKASYTFIQDEIQLPVSMGDMLGGLQTEVASAASIIYDPRWICLEPLAESGPYDIGSVIADKPMWVVFEVPFGSEGQTITLKYDGAQVEFTPVVDQCSKQEVLEQHLRCLTGVTLNKVTQAMKYNRITEALALLQAGLQVLSSYSMSPLVIRMKAQLDETLEEVQKSQRTNRADAGLLMRLTSLGGNYSAQRGITQMVNAQTPSRLFSSNTQEETSSRMAARYSQMPEDPIVDNC